MDLLKNSKKIIPFAMIGLMLTNSIAPAFAHGDHNADISSFQNAQSVTITQQVERNKEVEPSPDSLTTFKEHVTGRYVDIEEVLENGGVFHNPLNPKELMFINIDESVKLGQEYFENKDDYEIAKLAENTAKSIFEKEESLPSFYQPTESEGVDEIDYIHINSIQSILVGAELFLNSSIENNEYGARFVFYHEFGHSMSSMELLKQTQSQRESSSFKSANIKESFADVFGSIAVYKDMLRDMKNNKTEEEIDDLFKDFLNSVITTRSEDAKLHKEYKGGKGYHYTEIPLFVLMSVHHNNPGLLKDINMKEAEQLSSMIINRTLNHESVYNILYTSSNNMNKFNNDYEAKQELAIEIGSDILPEIQSMINVNENGKVSFNYNPNQESEILGKKPSTYKI